MDASVPSFLMEAVCETLWPSRCAICDAIGDVLCEQCARNLEFVDYWRTCPRCGAPWGLIQCDHCNPLVHPEGTPVLRCVSALRFTGSSARLIRMYKDQGEQRLASRLACFLFNSLPPSWIAWSQGVTYIPATTAALRRRGFDHMELIARELADMMNQDAFRGFERPASIDQRALSRTSRRANMEGRFRVVSAPLPERMLLIDDVFTTGSTMEQAQRTLQRSGCEVRCATVARV